MIIWGRPIGAFLKAYWRPLALLACVLGLFFAGWHLKGRIDAREAALAQAQQEAAQARLEAQAARDALALQEAATKAAQAARERNDAVLPKTRRDTAGRVDRAATADAATELRDDQEAIAAYRAAAGGLQRANAR